METVFVLLPLALFVAAVAVGFFIWAARTGQFDDLETPAIRILFDDEVGTGARVDTVGAGNQESGDTIQEAGDTIQEAGAGIQEPGRESDEIAARNREPGSTDRSHDQEREARGDAHTRGVTPGPLTPDS